jgi:anaerobic magnesium-protoporphyrin IX monomethyl ester cyclase
MLKRIKKGITLDQVVQATQACLDCGIAPHTSFILGLPGETPETLAQTLAFGERLKTMGVNHGYHILAPFPGTDVRERIDEYDLHDPVRRLAAIPCQPRHHPYGRRSPGNHGRHRDRR